MQEQEVLMQEQEALIRKLRIRNISRGCKKCILRKFIHIVVLLLLLFIIVPVVFKYSTGIQRKIIFPSWVIPPKNYSDIEASGIKGVRNFYVSLNGEFNITSDNNITLGVWQILPYDILSDLINNDDYNYERVLANGNYSILLYLHANGADRAAALNLYDILRKYFHIIAVDYRGYGDSSEAEMTETQIVDDMVQFYKWLKGKTNANIYVWGHSIGTGIGTHLLADLKKENISSNGLILEAPFTSITDIMFTNPIAMIFSFLPWFRMTIIEPIIYNDLNFESKKYILDVDCPVMILHAKDDRTVPYSYATDLYNAAVNNRNESYQGNITFHLFEAIGYRHMNIYKAPELPNYVRDFVDECDRFEKNGN